MLEFYVQIFFFWLFSLGMKLKNLRKQKLNLGDDFEMVIGEEIFKFESFLVVKFKRVEINLRMYFRIVESF